MASKPRDKIKELAEKYVNDELTFTEAFNKALNYNRTQEDFSNLLKILKEDPEKPKTSGCNFDNSM